MRQLAIVLLVVVVLGGTYYSVRTNTGVGPRRVQTGVKLDGKNIEGYTEAELGAYLDSLIAKQTEPPVQPKLDSVTKGVIPGLAGRKVDRTKTIAEALSASPNEQIGYIWDFVLPNATPLDVPIYQGNPHKQQITLVVNVAWGNDELVEMLDIFDRHSIKTSFFLVGRWADKFPELVQEIHKRGHEFGNHAYSDSHLPQLSDAKIAEEINRTTAAIQKAVDQVEVAFFSPPYNDFDAKVVRVAASLNYQTVICSLDTADWMRPGVERIVRRIVPNAHNGAIVLMHPTEQTPAALELLIPALISKGYELVPLSILLSPDR
ncbi:MAG: polysaccharide deacetylase family protein [Bacillota bacterium]|nr:polysaccharide deacetylase family protein [Bacillota bacterium]